MIKGVPDRSGTRRKGIRPNRPGPAPTRGEGPITDLYVGAKYAVKGYAGPATLVAVEDTGRIAPNGAPVRIASVRFGDDPFRPASEFFASRLSEYRTDPIPSSRGLYGVGLDTEFDAFFAELDSRFGFDTGAERTD